jgi:hypothetical protein
MGEFIDGAADYLGHIFMYVLIAAMLDDGFLGAWAWPLAVLSGLSRIAQSNHAETQRRRYLWRVYGVPWLGTQANSGKQDLSGGGWLRRASAAVARGYVALGELMAPCATQLDNLVEKEGANGETGAAARWRIRESARGSLALQKLLGANPRTILLGVCMIARMPVLYFLVEAIVLNGVLAFSVAYQNARERRLLAELQQLNP